MQIYSDHVGRFDLRIIHTLDDHDGTPLLVFNGIGASIELLEPVVRGLNLPVIAFDMPGTGQSPLTFVGFGMSDYAWLGINLLDQLGIEMVNVMGVSWGGGVAQHFARHHEHRMGKLILAATSTGQLMVPPNLEVLMHMASPMRYINPSYFKRIAPAIYGGDFRSNARLAIEHSKIMKAPNPFGYIQQLSAMSGWTSAFWIHQLKQETLVMAGEDDPIIPLINGRIMAERIPNAMLESFDCGHLFILTRRQQAIASIERFLVH
ncbi:MAG: poly(3-hydroxyalkanoate) depolymerase [Gammaproteobacteria bacterium]|nr:poly(3-hydroxyalkanoate) depolymerase [Gammaproteobacteria bacterium]